LASLLTLEEEVKRLEQVWLVLADLFESLSQNSIHVSIADELRNCRTLINFLRANISHPPIKELATIDDSLRNSQQILGKIKNRLISAALNLGEGYTESWMNEIDKAERAELDHASTYTVSKFVPSLPRDTERGWIRLTLRRPVAEERVQDVAEQLGVLIEFEDDLRIIISGEKASAKRAAQEIYELSFE